MNQNVGLYKYLAKCKDSLKRRQFVPMFWKVEVSRGH